MSANTTPVVQPIPYLFFDGNCADAMRFYEKALRGTIKVMMSGAQSPMADMIPKEVAHRILNAQLELPGGGLLYAGDARTDMPYKGISGFRVSLQYDTVEEAQARFEALAIGGDVTMPFGPFPWAKGFGMLTDQFGVGWMVNGEMLPM